MEWSAGGVLENQCDNSGNIQEQIARYSAGHSGRVV
jgi:hypothetical protein